MKSNQKLFTPQGQRDLTPSNIEGQIPCVAYGGDLTKATTFYIPPHRLVATLKKYADKGRTMSIPKAYLVDGVAVDIPKPIVVDAPQKKSRTKKEYIICLNDGKMFESRAEAARKYYLHVTQVTDQLTGRAKFARGRSFRFATKEEIETYKIDAWDYSGELLPIDNSFRR